MWFFTLSVNAWIVALIAFFSTAFSTFPTSQSKVAHLGRLTCGRFIQESTRVKHFKHGIHRFMWIFDRFTRAANFLENSHFLFAALPLTPLHVKCSPIEISPRALQFLASVPNIQIYCTARGTGAEEHNMGKLLDGIKSHSHKSRSVRLLRRMIYSNMRLFTISHSGNTLAFCHMNNFCKNVDFL